MMFVRMDSSALNKRFGMSFLDNINVFFSKSPLEIATSGIQKKCLRADIPAGHGSFWLVKGFMDIHGKRKLGFERFKVNA